MTIYGRSEELVSWCIECDLAEPDSLASLGGSAPVLVDGILSISNLCQYGWYEWCYFRDQTTAFPNNKEVLGRVFGPARGAGNEMAQWILKHC